MEKNKILLFEDFSKLYKRWHAGEVRDEDKARIEEFINRQIDKDEFYITDGDVVNCDCDVIIDDADLINGKFPVKFGVVEGTFDCSECKSLTSLEGAPENAATFDCSLCKSLTSLEGAPKTVNSCFYCSECESLTSLKGAPKEVGDEFDCNGCKSLTSLEGAPKKIGGNFDCSSCESLESLEGAPKRIGEDFICGGCKRNFTKDDLPEGTILKGGLYNEI